MLGLAAPASWAAETTGAAPAPASRSAGAETVAGIPSDSYPYSFAEASGQDGFAVDLFAAVARAMDLHVRRDLGTGRDLQARFARGNYDLLILYSHSKAREAIADFTVPYLVLQGGVYVRKGGLIQRYDDLRGQPFAVLGPGSPGEDFARDHQLTAHLQYASSSEEALRWVQAGTCAGAFVSRLTAGAVIDREKLKGLTILGEPLSDYQIRLCFAVHRGDATLLASLNEGLAIVHRTGEFDEIYRRWFGRIDAPLISPREVVIYGMTTLLLALGVALAGFFRQRTLRKRVARQATELAEQRELLQALYDHIPIGLTVIVIAADGPRLISMNRAAGRLYGVDPAQAGNLPLARSPLPDGPRRHFEEVLRRRPLDQKIVHYEHPLEGSRGVLEVMIVPLAPEAGDCPRLCVLAEDVSDRKLLDAELAQSRRLRAVGELVGGIAHEFNNLLTPMMLKVGSIQMDWSRDARLQEEIEVILQATQRAAELTRRLLTFGRKSEGPGESARLSDLVTASLDLLRPTIDRRITWTSDVPDNLPPLRLNATDLNQILINLLLNARDTLLEKLSLPHDDDWTAHIHVYASALPPSAVPATGAATGTNVVGWQKLTVQDTGLGMVPAVVERIFEPFFTTKGVGKGTGLGLATVWHIVTEAGGRVEVDSRPGKGTAFHLYLPVGSATDSPAAPAAARPGAPPLKASRVLLVEDEHLVAQTVMAILRRGGHDVRHFDNGAAAWKHLAENSSRYQLLVIDVNLPGLSGLELVARLRERNFPGRILVVGGRLSMSDLRTLVQLHVERVLSKPFTALQFETALRDGLS